VTDLLEIIESNRFVGRVFLLWLWFESEVFETNLGTSKGARLAIWLESKIALSYEGEEVIVKSAVPGQAPEAKNALRQGKLPSEAKLRATDGAREFAFTFKADTLSLSALAIPAELDTKEDEMAEVVKDRMRITDELEVILDDLFEDFVALRLSTAWSELVLPSLRQFARGRQVDAEVYREKKKAVFERRAKKK
jgi:hypothetical protein